MRQVPSIIKLPALVLLLACACASSADERPADAQSLAALFASAWNAHDPAAFGALMAEDADWVTASGLRLRGRAKIQGYLAEEHSTWAKRTTMQASNIHVRPLNAKISIVSFEWTITTPGEEGSTPSIARGNNLFVSTNEKGWTVVSGQVARARTQ